MADSWLGSALTQRWQPTPIQTSPLRSSTATADSNALFTLSGSYIIGDTAAKTAEGLFRLKNDLFLTRQSPSKVKQDVCFTAVRLKEP